VAEDPRHGALESFEVPGAGVGFVPDELPRELFLAHGSGPIGAHVEGYLGRGQVDGVEVGLG
jgi:hypothetical protein